MNKTNQVTNQPGLHPFAKYSTQYRALLTTLVGIFFAEVVAMVVIFFLDIPSYWLTTLVDSSIMVTLIFPLLYYFSLRPLLKEIADKEKAETALHNSHKELETLVVERTKALAKTNEALRKSQDELEMRVQERTRELEKANQGLLAEIAERKRVAAQLRLQTQALESAANGIFITDKTGKIVWANQAISDMTGYERNEIVGHSPNILQSGQHPAEFYRDIWDTVNTGKVWHGEIVNRKKSGEIYIEEQTITPVLDDSNEIGHFIAIKQDITEQKQASEALQRANQELLLMSQAEHQQRLLAEGLVQSLIALNTSLDLTSVLDQIMEQALRVIPATAVAIILVQDKQAIIARQLGKKSYPKATGSLSDTLSLDAFPIWKMICEKNESVIVPDTSKNPNWRSIQSSDWIRSSLCAPLTVSGQVIGIINLNSDIPNTFQPEMAGMLKAFATPAAVAIQNARLYSAEQKARLNAETLSAASTALTQTLEFESVLEVLLDYMQIAIPYDAAMIVLSEEESHYHARMIRDTQACPLYVDEVNSLIEVKWGSLIEGQIQKREAVLVPNVSQDPKWRVPKDFEKIRCLLSLPLETKDKVIGVVIVIRADVETINNQNSQIAQAIVSQAAVAMQNAWLFEQVRAGREHLQMLSRRLVEVQETERREIARELHDETGQALTSLKLGLRLLEKDANNPKNVIGHVAELRETTDNVMESLHRLAMNLRPASLDHLGLIATLKNFVDNVRQQSGLKAKFRALGFSNELGIPENIETALYRIVQEALTNIIRHANASRADVILEHRDNKIVLIIEDDGRGLGTRELSSPDHLGIIGMRERTEQIGGKMILESTRGMGTTIVVEVPFGN
jgi:PAS domain S-box-containing protein